MICPRCQGCGEVESPKPVRPAPVDLPPLQFQIYDIVRSGRGLRVSQIVDRLYADREDGGPDDAENTVRVQVWKLNRKLSTAGEKIAANRLGPNATYRLGRL